MAAASVTRTPRSLYRHLLRKLSPLPTEAQEHYKHRIKQEFNSYSKERDPERIQQITEQALRDIEWLSHKYGKPKS